MASTWATVGRWCAMNAARFGPSTSSMTSAMPSATGRTSVTRTMPGCCSAPCTRPSSRNRARIAGLASVRTFSTCTLCSTVCRAR